MNYVNRWRKKNAVTLVNLDCTSSQNWQVHCLLQLQNCIRVVERNYCKNLRFEEIGKN